MHIGLSCGYFSALMKQIIREKRNAMGMSDNNYSNFQQKYFEMEHFCVERELITSIPFLSIFDD
jgi:hypothetical protein